MLTQETRERDRQTDRERDRQTERETERDRERQRERKAAFWVGRHKKKKIDKKMWQKDR